MLMLFLSLPTVVARVMTDVVVVLHLAFIVYVMLGGVLALKWQRAAWVHLPCAAWGMLIEFQGWICPLTPLENYFREASGGSTYQGGFIEHHLLPIIYPAGLTREIQVGLGLAVLAVNLAIYGVVAQRWRRRRRERHSPV